MSTLQYIEVETQPEPNASVIWLHGLGASGHDFEPIVPELTLPMAVRFIFPHAPNKTITVNGGMVMPAWYDIISIDIERRIDTDQIMDSSDAINELIEQEIARGIPSENIVIAGFSQGGGSADDIVPEVLGQQANTALRERGYAPDYYRYPIPHSVCMEEINDISQWLQRCLG